MFSRILQWFLQCIMNTPSSLYSSKQCCIGHAYFNRPILQTLCTSFIGEPDISPSISRLFGTGSPSAICKTIRPVIVNTFKRCSWRAPSHIMQELRKALYPFWGNGNASSSVIPIAIKVRIQTSLFHVCPDAIFLRTLSMFCFSMFIRAFVKTYSSFTSTIFRCAMSQCRSSHSTDYSTRTLAYPIDARFYRTRLRQYFPSSKSLVSQIHDWFLLSTSTTLRFPTAKHRCLNNTFRPTTTAAEHIPIAMSRRIRRDNGPISECLTSKIRSGSWHNKPSSSGAKRFAGLILG